MCYYLKVKKKKSWSFRRDYEPGSNSLSHRKTIEKTYRMNLAWKRSKQKEENACMGNEATLAFFAFNFNFGYKGVVTKSYCEEWKERKVLLWNIKLFEGKTSSPSFFHETFKMLSLFHKIFEEKDREELRWLVRLVRHKWREEPNRTESSKPSKEIC